MPVRSPHCWWMRGQLSIHEFHAALKTWLNQGEMNQAFWSPPLPLCEHFPMRSVLFSGGCCRRNATIATFIPLTGSPRRLSEWPPVQPWVISSWRFSSSSLCCTCWPCRLLLLTWTGPRTAVISISGMLAIAYWLTFVCSHLILNIITCPNCVTE